MPDGLEAQPPNISIGPHKLKHQARVASLCSTTEDLYAFFAPIKINDLPKNSSVISTMRLSGFSAVVSASMGFVAFWSSSAVGFFSSMLSRYHVSRFEPRAAVLSNGTALIRLCNKSGTMGAEVQPPTIAHDFLDLRAKQDPKNDFELITTMRSL